MVKIPLSRPTSIYEKGVYPPEFNDDFKAYIRNRDDNICAVCKEAKSLDVHHIDYTKRTVPVNCVSLCRDCHKKVHDKSNTRLDRWTWKIRFHRMVLLREGARTFTKEE